MGLKDKQDTLSEAWFEDNIQLREFISTEERRRRQKLGYKYFKVGSLYRAKKAFVGAKAVNENTRTSIDVERGSYLLCVTSEPKKSILEYRNPNAGPVGKVCFLYKEVMLRYVSDFYSICCMLDPVEIEDNE